MRQGMRGVPSPTEYLSKQLSANAVVGVDPFLHSAGVLDKLEKALREKNITIKSLTVNPVDLVWR